MKTKHILSRVGLFSVVMVAVYYELRPVPGDDISALQAPASGFGIPAEEEAAAIPVLLAGPSERVEWTHQTPAAFRARTVTPDFTRLTADPLLKAGDPIRLALFNDAVVEGVLSDVTSYPNGTVGMTAKLSHDFQGFLYLAYSGSELRVSVDVLGGHDFYVRYDPVQQRHVALEVDWAASDYDGDCGVCDPVAIAADGISDDIDPAMPGASAMPAEVSPETLNVDVMVVYTPAAKTAEGGLNGINNNIALAMQRANTTHGNSDTWISLTLVHSAETAYTESGNSSLDLRRLTYTGSTNTAMDEVQGLRDTYGADFICLFEDEPGTGGKGWLLTTESGRPDLAYCLARVQQTDWAYTVVHEWAHNMGCSHSKDQANSPWKADEMYSYSAGWQWEDSGSSASVGYCSVMTYENFDGVGSSEYRRVPHFSNPDIDYTDNSTRPTGDTADGDNARTIRGLRYMLADYRISNETVSSFPSSNSFEQAYSPWKYYGSDIDWKRDREGTPTPSSGPSSGQDGDWYIYLEASGEDPGDEAHLSASFDFSALSFPAVSFAYHMNDAGANHMGTLVLEASTNDGSTWQTLWTKHGNQGDLWFTANIDLSVYAGAANTTLRFRGVRGANFRSDMALDSIVVQGLSDDSDGDGMPNAWEMLYFGGPTNAHFLANPDSDAYNNLQEYIAGLNPTNSDGFGPSNFMVGVNNAFEWDAANGRVYSVYWSSNLLDGFSIVQSNLTSGAYTDTVHSAEAQGFYKLEVEVAP